MHLASHIVRNSQKEKRKPRKSDSRFARLLEIDVVRFTVELDCQDCWTVYEVLQAFSSGRSFDCRRFVRFTIFVDDRPQLLPRTSNVKRSVGEWPPRPKKETDSASGCWLACQCLETGNKSRPGNIIRREQCEREVQSALASFVVLHVILMLRR